MQNSKTNISAKDRKRCFIDDEGGEEQQLERETRKANLHMENQERAYVAASRRTDRSLEARYQSALMASEVHKKRTGKSLRITYKIVKNGEMYEEEDHGPSEYWLLSPNGYRGRTWSQTDAYISALIARKSGVQNLFEDSHTLFTMPTPNNTAWTERTPSALAYSNLSMLPGYQMTGFDNANDDFADLPKLEANATSNLAGEMGPGLDPCFAESATFLDMTSHTHTSSSNSSISDISSCNFNYVLGPSTDPESTREWSHIRLEDCLLDADGERFVSLDQIGTRV